MPSIEELEALRDKHHNTAIGLIDELKPRDAAARVLLAVVHALLAIYHELRVVNR